jgi:hypothetical protein
MDGSYRPEDQDSHDRAARLKRRFDALKGSTERTNCETHWQEVAELVSPRKLDFVGIRTPGEKRMNRVMDPSAIHANELLAAGLHGMATNPAMRWFSLRMLAEKVAMPDGKSGDINDLKEVQTYLSDVEEKMWQRIYQPGSHFTTAIHEAYLDLGAFGTAIMFVGERDSGGLLFQSRPLAECVIAENHEGRVDTVFRRTTYTVRQMWMMKQSGEWKSISDRVKDAYMAEKFEEEVVVIHAVMPRTERDPAKKGPKDKPYASCYFEHDCGHMLDESGFDEFPYFVVRWSKYANEVYGRSPAMTALPDIKMLQAMSITVMKAAHKAVDPPIWLRDDGVVGQTRTVPGGINYFRGNPNEGVMMAPTDGRAIPMAMDIMEQIRNRIRNVFFVDIMQMVTDQQMTATEVMQRTSERMRLLGPLIGRLEAEMLGPMVERIFGILDRLKLIPKVPEILSEREFTVEYVSPIATAQKQQATQGIAQVMQLLGMFGPEIGVQIAAKKLDTDKLFAWAWDLFNNDPDLLRDEETIAEMNALQKQQMQLGAAQPAVEMAATGARAMKDVSQGAAATAGQGMDWGRMLQALQGSVAENPRAQREISDLAEPAADAAAEAELAQ